MLDMIDDQLRLECRYLSSWIKEAGANKRLTAGKTFKTKETAVCQAFTDTITAAGYRAGVYASYAWIKNYINTDALLMTISLWVARYNNTTTKQYKIRNAICGCRI